MLSCSLFFLSIYLLRFCSRVRLCRSVAPAVANSFTPFLSPLSLSVHLIFLSISCVIFSFLLLRLSTVRCLLCARDDVLYLLHLVVPLCLYVCSSSFKLCLEVLSFLFHLLLFLLSFFLFLFLPPSWILFLLLLRCRLHLFFLRARMRCSFSCELVNVIGLPKIKFSFAILSTRFVSRSLTCTTSESNIRVSDELYKCKHE